MGGRCALLSQFAFDSFSNDIFQIRSVRTVQYLLLNVTSLGNWRLIERADLY